MCISSYQNHYLLQGHCLDLMHKAGLTSHKSAILMDEKTLLFITLLSLTSLISPINDIFHRYEM